MKCKAREIYFKKCTWFTVIPIITDATSQNTEWNIDLLFDGISQMTSDDLSSSIKVYSTEINQPASSRLASGLHDW